MMTEISKLSFLLALSAGLACASVRAEEAPQPNVVVIISDDQGFGDYGFMGHPVIQTPHLDRMADESLLFTRGYVTTALCSPSLATMLTGLYPHQHGITGNDPVKGQNRQDWIQRFGEQPQLPAMLREAGYLSLHTGKYWQGDPVISGFTDHMGATQRHGSKASLGIGRDGMQPIYDFIEKAQAESKPFLVWYAPFLPHTPHTPPERLLAKYRDKVPNLRQAKYFAMCEWLDETCGELLGHLDDKGLRENTIVLFICDNGWPGSAKGTPNEQGIRTPTMIRWPGKVAPHRDESNLASNIDLVPTILSACGLEPTPGMPGLDLLDQAAVEGRTTIYAENFAHDMVNHDRPAESLRARSCITKDWKLTVWQNPQPKVRIAGWQTPAPEEQIELFDLNVDPHEKENLAGKHPEKVAEMRAQLDAWWNPGPSAKADEGPTEPTTRSINFKTVGDRTLKMKGWDPHDRKAGEEKRPAGPSCRADLSALASAEAEAGRRRRIRRIDEKQNSFQPISHARKPNIVLIMADDMGYAGLSCSGNRAFKTPHLDQLAAEGLRFTDFHSNGAVCSPTRAALLTGRYQQRTGVDGVVNADPQVAYHHRALQPDEVTFAEAMKTAGYATGMCGKWHVGYARKYNPSQQGFDRFVGFVSGNIDYISHYDRMETFDWWHNLELNREAGYSTHLINRHSLEFIEENKDRPFCLYVAHEAIHNPNQGPDDPAIRGPEKRPRKELSPVDEAVKAMTLAMDEGVGQITAKLRELGIEKETLVIFISDNGGTGQNKSTGDRVRGRKGSIYEGGHRVPGIAWWPGRIKPGTTSDETAIGIDLMPTMMALGGARVPDGHQLDGIDLSGLLLDGKPLPRRQLFWALQGGRAMAVREGPWKLVVSGARPAELYHLGEDLKEADDRAAEHPELAAKLRAALDAWQEDVKATATEQPPPPASAGGRSKQER